MISRAKRASSLFYQGACEPQALMMRPSLTNKLMPIPKTLAIIFTGVTIVNTFTASLPSLFAASMTAPVVIASFATASIKTKNCHYY